jgi:hypothetical protein
MDAVEKEGTMTSALCPRCGAEIRIELSAPGGGKTTRTAGILGQIVGRIIGGSPARYESEAAPLVAQPHGLNAGEKAYRTMDVPHDVKAPWRLSMRAAMPLGVVILCAGAVAKWPSSWPFGVGIGLVFAADGRARSGTWGSRRSRSEAGTCDGESH